MVLMSVLPAGAAVGDFLAMGRVNTADAVTVVKGAAAANVRVVNTQPGGASLYLRVVAGSPPLRVNSALRVSNFNADLLDGLHGSAFLPASGIAADSSLLDGLDSTAFAAASHSHDEAYLAIGGTAADSQLLDG